MIRVGNASAKKLHMVLIQSIPKKYIQTRQGYLQILLIRTHWLSESNGEVSCPMQPLSDLTCSIKYF